MFGRLIGQKLNPKTFHIQEIKNQKWAYTRFPYLILWLSRNPQFKPNKLMIIVYVMH